MDFTSGVWWEGIQSERTWHMGGNMEREGWKEGWSVGVGKWRVGKRKRKRGIWKKSDNTLFTRYNRLSNRLSNRVERTATVRSTGCQTGLYNRFDNRQYT